ncbi:phosphatidylinositol 3 and 4-kinase-domain-containing protein [Baffinella frigidus]|nr:phosphatidylinositol 3 and 4-kinase-domain-containing protein [Cryptophyta sp. CCMP2293]
MMYNSRGEVAAVFKPIDEEPFGPSNPKGFVGRADEESQMKRGIPVGGGAVRECAAFLLDHDGRAAVPATTMLRISHTTLLPDQAEVQIKVGSLQRFCPHECTAEDIGTAGFGVDQVHAIGIFDARIFNMDRNSDNLLVASKKGVWSARTLIPIDHGYILPSIQHLEEVQVCWLHWPQAHVPFSPSTLATIAALDAKAEGAMLRATLGFGEEALMTLFLGTAIVQHAARAGLTLHDIGMLATPGDSGNSPSSVEKLVAHALASVPADWHLCGPAAVEAVQAAMLVGVEDLVAGAVDQLRRRRASSLFQV